MNPSLDCNALSLQIGPQEVTKVKGGHAAGALEHLHPCRERPGERALSLHDDDTVGSAASELSRRPRQEGPSWPLEHGLPHCQNCEKTNFCCLSHSVTYSVTSWAD